MERVCVTLSYIDGRRANGKRPASNRDGKERLTSMSIEIQIGLGVFFFQSRTLEHPTEKGRTERRKQ